MPLGEEVHGDFEFTTMTYNVLAECYVLPSRYSHCPEFARRWNYRSKQIIKEISTYNPDVLFLQVFNLVIILSCALISLLSFFLSILFFRK